MDERELKEKLKELERIERLVLKTPGHTYGQVARPWQFEGVIERMQPED